MAGGGERVKVEKTVREMRSVGGGRCFWLPRRLSHVQRRKEPWKEQYTSYRRHEGGKHDFRLSSASAKPRVVYVCTCTSPYVIRCSTSKFWCFEQNHLDVTNR